MKKGKGRKTKRGKKNKEAGQRRRVERRTIGGERVDRKGKVFRPIPCGLF